MLFLGLTSTELSYYLTLRVNISETEMQTYMRRSVRLATEMADKKFQRDCSSCCGEDKLRNASKTLAAQDETTSSEEAS